MMDKVIPTQTKPNLIYIRLPLIPESHHENTLVFHSQAPQAVSPGQLKARRLSKAAQNIDCPQAVNPPEED
jgi:hypothetical protein